MYAEWYHFLLYYTSKIKCADRVFWIWVHSRQKVVNYMCIPYIWMYKLTVCMYVEQGYMWSMWPGSAHTDTRLQWQSPWTDDADVCMYVCMLHGLRLSDKCETHPWLCCPAPYKTAKPLYMDSDWDTSKNTMTAYKIPSPISKPNTWSMQITQVSICYLTCLPT